MKYLVKITVPGTVEVLVDNHTLKGCPNDISLNEVRWSVGVNTDWFVLVENAGFPQEAEAEALITEGY